MKADNKLRALALVTAMAVLPLGACGTETAETDSEAAAEVSNETLASALADDDSLSTVSTAMSDTGLGQVFDSTAAYTILAPTDDAFAKVEQDETIDDEERQALLAAILREHILPGALTPDDIRSAIETQKGAVTMTTMGDGTLTFTTDGEGIRVTDSDGSTAMLSSEPMLASNGVAIPIDAVLKKP